MVTSSFTPSSPPDVVLDIQGMMCQQNCAFTVAECIRGFPSIKGVIVTQSSGTAEIWFNEEEIAEGTEHDLQPILHAIDMVGYDATLKTDNRKNIDTDHLPLMRSDDLDDPDLTLLIKNMKSNQDVQAVRKVLLTVEGVIHIDILDNKKIVKIWGFADLISLIEALQKANFAAVDYYKGLLENGNGVDPGGILDVEAAQSPLHNEDLSPHETINTKGKREYLYSVRGMSCGSCSAKIERTLSAMRGVTSCTVSIMTHQAIVIVDDSIEDAPGPRDIMEKVNNLGYSCKLISCGDSSSGRRSMDRSDEDLRQWRFLLIVSLVFGTPILLLHLVGQFIPPVMKELMRPDFCQGGVTVGQMVMLFLNLPILIVVGKKYYYAAFVGALNGSFGMDFLVMTGTSITFIYSTWQLILACEAREVTHQVFFETTGMLLMFVTIGKYIESFAKGRSASAMTELLNLQPTEAFVVTGKSADGINDENIPNPLIYDEDVGKLDVDLVQKGDIVKVLPGQRIPTDGVLILGTTSVDESMITGESMPVVKEKGSLLFGSTVNLDSCIYLRVTSYGSESALAQIVRLVESAQLNKAPVQDFADRVASLFTPFILLIATCTFFCWLTLCESHIVPKVWFEENYDDPVLFSLLFAISVVVISCPCALGLATPTAIMVGTVVGAKNGILIKGGSAFEVSHKVNTVIFDKTGTLTEGKPSVTDVILINKSENEEENKTNKTRLLWLAATAEQCSEHPIALAVLKTAKRRNISPMALQENSSVMYIGSGVSCATPLGEIAAGNRSFMKTKGITVNAAADTVMWNLEIQGKTAVCVALADEVIGVLGVADVVKPEAESVIKALRGIGIDVWMVTGDNATTAEALAHKLDLSADRVLAGVLPQDKSKKVKDLQTAGKVVAMVGDGINDSPALVQADLGIAIGAGTQIAIEAASMVLIRSNLHDLVVALDLAKVVFHRIRWNFLWAVIYNFVAIPFAAGVWYPWTKMALPPHYAGLAMAASSISVVISSMLLRLYRRPDLTDDVHASQTDSVCDHCCALFTTSTPTVPVGHLTGRYNQLPIDDSEGEQYLGIELGLGRSQIMKSNDRIRDDAII